MRTLSNFIAVENKLPWRTTICYMDRRTPYPIGYEMLEELPIRFRYEARNDEGEFSDFVFVLCSFNKKYNDDVDEVMERLDKYLILTERDGYLKFKEYANNLFEGALEYDVVDGVWTKVEKSN